MVPKTSPDHRAYWFAHIAIATTVLFFLVMFIAFLFIQPDLNPLHRYGSEYSAGRLGWLMKLNFFLWGSGLIGFALAMKFGLDPRARSWVAIILFMIAGAGIFLSGVFDADLQVLNENPPPKWIEAPASNDQIKHVIAGLVAFFSLMPGIGLVSRRLRKAGRLSGVYRFLRHLSWLIPALFIASIFLFGPTGLTGLGQRIFLASVFTWIILAANGLAKGAFLKSD